MQLFQKTRSYMSRSSARVTLLLVAFGTLLLAWFLELLVLLILAGCLVLALIGEIAFPRKWYRVRLLTDGGRPWRHCRGCRKLVDPGKKTKKPGPEWFRADWWIVAYGSGTLVKENGTWKVAVRWPFRTRRAGSPCRARGRNTTVTSCRMTPLLTCRPRWGIFTSW
jgi:hypothetical protein